MTRLICLEPADPGAAWYPFTGARPIAELRAGAWRIRERWAGILGVDDVVVMGGHAAGFRDVDSAEVIPPGRVTGPAIVARSDFAPAGHNLDFETGPRRLTHGRIPWPGSWARERPGRGHMKKATRSRSTGFSSPGPGT